MCAAFHALPARPRSALCRVVRPGRTSRFRKEIYRLTLPDPDPIAVLISVLAGQQDASTAVMAEVRRFVTLAR